MKKIALILSFLATGPALGMRADAFLLWSKEGDVAFPPKEQAAKMPQRVTFPANIESALHQQRDVLLRESGELDASMCLLQGDGASPFVFSHIFFGGASPDKERGPLPLQRRGTFFYEMPNLLSLQAGDFNSKGHYELLMARISRSAFGEVYIKPDSFWQIGHSNEQENKSSYRSPRGEKQPRYSCSIEDAYVRASKALAINPDIEKLSHENNWKKSPLVVRQFLVGLDSYWEGFPKIDAAFHKSMLYYPNAAALTSAGPMQLDAAQFGRLQAVVDGFGLGALPKASGPALPRTVTLYITSSQRMDPLSVAVYAEGHGVKEAVQNFLLTARAYQAVQELRGYTQLEMFGHFEALKTKGESLFMFNVVATSGK